MIRLLKINLKLKHHHHHHERPALLVREVVSGKGLVIARWRRLTVPGGAAQTHRPTTVAAGAGLCSADTDCVQQCHKEQAVPQHENRG